MIKYIHRFTLYAIIIYLTCGTLNPAVAATQPLGGHETHFCGVIDGQWNKRYADQFPNRRYARTTAANLKVGEPRTVRLIYFLPNDRPYRAEVVQRMKYEILSMQTFFAEQMAAHGYGKLTFRFETDPQGEPIVHRVDGQYADSRYFNNTDLIYDEIERTFDLNVNIYLIVIDNSGEAITEGATGTGSPRGRSGGSALVNEEFSRDLAGNLATHELGHAFGLGHDFRDGAYIMSYGGRALIGPPWNQLSACHAEKLSVHPYFNPDIPLEKGQPPTIDLISSHQYLAGSKSVLIQLKASDSEGLHQVLLYGSDGLIGCRELRGEKDTLIEFDYDGVFLAEGFTNLSDSMSHPIRVEVIDTEGNVGYASFALAEISPHHITTFEGHTTWVNSVSFSPNGTTLASGARDGSVLLWDVVTQQNIATLEWYRHTVRSVSFSSDGITLAVGLWAEVQLWDVATRQNIATLPHIGEVNSVSFSSDGITLASGVGEEVQLWDVATRQNIATLEGHTNSVRSMSFSRDGTTLAVGLWSEVKLWDVATHQNIATLPYTEGGTSVSFSRDGTTLAVGLWSEVQLWDVATRQNIATLEGHTDWVNSVSFSRDGTTLASGSWDTTVKLWDVPTGVSFATFPHTSRVNSVLFSPVGTTLASGTSEGTVELWDTSGLMEVRLEAVAEIHLRDPNLRAAIVEAIGRPPSTPIFWGHLRNLTHLDARNANISDLTGLEGATNLKGLYISGNSITDISAVAGLNNLRVLYISDSSITDISAVTGLNNLRVLYISDNSITDISAVAGLNKLRALSLANNSITDISAVANLINLTSLNLVGNSITDISAVADLTNLTSLNLVGNSITDISAIAGLINLTSLSFGVNSISDISALAGLINLTLLEFAVNSVSDISAVAGLTSLTRLRLQKNSVSDISALAGLINLIELGLGDNSVSDISAVASLTNLRYLDLTRNNISDLSSLVANTGLGEGDGVDVWGNPLSYLSIHMHIPALESRGVRVGFDNRTHPALLKISGDNQTGAAFAPLSQPFVVEAQDRTGAVLAGISVTFAVTAGGGTLTTTTARTDNNGRAQSTLILGPNLGTNTVSVSAVGIETTATFYAIADSELPPTTADVNNDGLVNVLDLILIASSLGQSGYNSADVNGDGTVSILDLVLAAGMFDEAAAAPSAQPQVPETLTAVEVQGWLTDTKLLEVKDPIMKRGIIVLEQLLVSLTPTETKLLANYPNPFNPETWIPYRLAEDAFVTLTIYDGSGQLICTLNVGHRIAAVYESQSKAIYWDGKNGLGEQVASGVYFYTLMAGDYSATRKMLILK